ncbi:MAG TPA: prolyl oligopeptidase family serine peptidase [Caulobacteraceae bacterium]
MLKAIDRRTLMVSAAAVGSSALAARTFAAPPSRPPVASLRPVSEVLHGVTITDRYRWMEDAADPEWMPYLLAQNAYARQVLAAIPGRAALAERIAAVTGALGVIAQVQAAGPYVFTELRPAGANTFKLMVREGVDGPDRLLIDPDSLASAGTHFSLDYWQASPDGRLVVYGVSPAGSENSVLHFIETGSGRVLPDSLDRAQFGGPTWLPDSSGVFFNRLKAGTKHGDPDHYLDSVAWIHRLGADPAADVKVLARGLDPSVPMQPIDTPFVVAQVGSTLALGIVASGVQNEVTAYATTLSAAEAGKPAWRKVCDPDDGVTGFALRGDDLFLLTHKGAPRFRILRTSAAAPSFASASEVVPEGPRVLKGMSAARDGLYIQALDAGLGAVLRLGQDGAVTPLNLPFAGSVSALYTDPLQDGCWFLLDGWVHPAVLCRGGPDGSVTVTDIAPKAPFDVSRYESRELMVTVRDGTRVPLSIIYAKGARQGGPAPLYLQAYGAYGLDIDPGFSPRFLPWLDLGGVYAVAHVRGGGELGEAWHKAGEKATKPNTWRDCIDCAQWLIDNRWTSPGKLAVEGTSAGGIMVGRFLTERPDLLTVALVRVGDSNATRFEFMEAGPANIPEFGSIKTPEGFKGLLEMDAYQHVKDGVAYPAVMLTTGITDPRVASWEPGKFAARLQTATSSGRPVILRVETDAGHGLGSTRKQRDDESADTYAFILWQTGDPRFQPRP